jgi:MFS family permease
VSAVGTAVRETVTSLRTIAANRGLRRLNLALAASMVGDWAYATAIVVWAYQQGGAAAVGIWGTVRLTVLAIATPFASTLADRLPRVAVMVGSDLGRAAIMAGAAVVIATGGPDLAVYALATVAALVAAPFRPAQLALLPSLVHSPEELTAANGVGSTLESLAFFLGPALGGVLLTVSSVPVVIAVQVATLLVSAALVASVPRRPHAPAEDPPAPPADPEPAADDGGSGGFWRESAAGFRAIAAEPDLRLVTLLYSAQTLVAGASLVFEVTMADDLLGIGPEGVGYLDSVLGVGALVGGLVAIALAKRGRLASDFGLGVLFWGVPLLLVTLLPGVGTAFAAMFVIGVANPVADVNANTIMQRVVPDAVLGRVFGALDTVLIAAMALGTLITPLLIDAFGIRGALAALAVPVVLAVAVGWPRLRRLDTTLGEPAHYGLLRSLPVFAPLQRTELEAVALQLEPREVPAGTTVLREGEAGDRFYVVESGTVDVVRHGEVVARLTEGDVFGEVALLRDVPRTASVVALDDCMLQTLDREAFLAAVANVEVRSRIDAMAAKRLPAY